MRSSVQSYESPRARLRNVCAAWHVMVGSRWRNCRSPPRANPEKWCAGTRRVAPETIPDGGRQTDYSFVCTTLKSEARGAASDEYLAPRPGLEPGTCGLTERRSL